MKRLIARPTDREVLKSYVRDFVNSTDCDDANLNPSDLSSIAEEIIKSPEFDDIVKLKTPEYKYPDRKVGLIQQLVNNQMMKYLRNN